MTLKIIVSQQTKKSLLNNIKCSYCNTTNKPAILIYLNKHVQTWFLSQQINYTQRLWFSQYYNFNIHHTTLTHMAQRHETSYAVQRQSVDSRPYRSLYKYTAHSTSSRMTVCIQGLWLTAWLQLKREVQWLTCELFQHTLRGWRYYAEYDEMVNVQCGEKQSILAHPNQLHSTTLM